MIASNRGCIFVRVSDTGYIVEELFEIYFNNTPLNFVGYINFKNFFVTTRNSKQVLFFNRAQDTDMNFFSEELRYIEYSTLYEPLVNNLDEDWHNKWMVGYSGTKLYLHNF